MTHRFPVRNVAPLDSRVIVQENHTMIEPAYKKTNKYCSSVSRSYR